MIDIQEVHLKSNYLIDNLEKASESEVYQSLPTYERSKNSRVALQAGTGLGKTTLAMHTAQLFLEQGAKHVIIAFPKIMIGKNKADENWEMLFDGKTYGVSDYPKTILCTYDNLYLIPESVLKNSVVWLDELHEFATSSFRPKLKIVINKLFALCPYIIGMSGTISHLVFQEEFSIFLKIKEKEPIRRVLHDVVLL